MTVRLLLFARYRELLGARHLDLEVREGTTAGDLYGLMEAREPALAELRPYVAIAVNREVVGPSHLLTPGDEVAFLQPVSGG